jgi:hypothetical protein
MKKFLSDRFPSFLNDGDVIVEEDSQTTIENAIFGKTLFDRLSHEVFKSSNLTIGLLTK